MREGDAPQPSRRNGDWTRDHKMFLRCLKLWLSLAKFSLLGELAFRGNFLVKVVVELLWIGILLLFNYTIFQQTETVANWKASEYFFFIGCYFAMGGLIETLFLENCNQFADLVRSGDLDFILLKPIDEQFLVSCKQVDWSCAPNFLLGVAVMGIALWSMGWSFDLGQALLFVLLFCSGAVMAYGFLLLLTSASVWLMRNQSLFELWWLFSTLMRYPREIFQKWASPAGLFFFFVVPIMLVTNVPARVMVKPLEQEWWLVLYALAAALIVAWLSRRVFRAALQRYRSASS
jgi:ABC-2 type transport system permease protein